MRLTADRSERLDQFLARSLPSFSRTRLARLVQAGAVRVDGGLEKPSFRLEPGMAIDLEPPRETPAHDLAPYPIELRIVFEDDDLLVVDKPRGLATHPAPSLSAPSLVNALLAHGEQLSAGTAPFRPGIVHRLDKETTGLIIVAKTDAAHAHLAAQIADRTAGRRYLAIVSGEPDAPEFQIDAPIARDPRNRLRMALDPKGRDARTHVRVLRRTAAGSLLALRLFTGRTHQIRVHLCAVGLPIVGDELYGGGSGPLQLHASALKFTHPSTGAVIALTSRPPRDFLIDVTDADLARLVDT